LYESYNFVHALDLAGGTLEEHAAASD